jgi:hypothetical protein
VFDESVGISGEWDGGENNFFLWKKTPVGAAMGFVTLGLKGIAQYFQPARMRKIIGDEAARRHH